MSGYGIAWIYLGAVNLIAFIMMGADKRRARRGLRRIPESSLLLPAVLGGCVGSLAGMYLFRHKTRKPKFSVGVPAILIVQALLTYAVTRRF